MEDQTQEPTDAPDSPAAPATAEPAIAAAKPARARPTKRAPARKIAKPKKARAAATKAPASTAAKPRRRHVSRFLVLFRHGLAEDHSATMSDGDRTLTTDGHAKTKRAARGLEEIFPEADTLFSSPLVRAMQTALWLTKAYGEKLKVQVTDALLPGADPRELAELLATQEGRNVIVVGHEPHLTNAMSHFIGTASLRADLKKAGCVGIQLDTRGRGTLEWMLAPRMLRRLD